MYIPLLLILISVSVEVLLGQQPKLCPDDWLYYDGKEGMDHVTISCYYISDLLESWSSASNTRRAFRGELVVIESADENEFLANEIRKHGNFGTSIYTSHFWLDGTDIVHEGHLVWATTVEKWDFTLWWKGAPNGGRFENCLEFGSHWNFTWNDAHCADRKHFICEKPAFADNQLIGR